MNYRINKSYIDEITGVSWVSVVENSGVIYTREYVFNKDRTITYHITRSDGTTDTYDYGKYLINGKKIKYQNPEYPEFGAKYEVLEYDSNENAIYIIKQNIRTVKFESTN